MLNTLSKVDPHIASGALAAAMLQLVGPSSPSVSDEMRKMSDNLLNEVRLKLGLEQDDRRPEALNQIRSVLSEEVDRILLGSRDRQQILDRLGSSGDLPLGVYEVRATNEFRDFREKLSFAKDCIVGCDQLVHLIPNEDANGKQWSLFSKGISDKRGNINYYVIVQAMRSGQSLSVTNLWRIHPQVVSVESAEPMSLLKVFVNHYGVRIGISGNMFEEKFVLDKKIPLGFSGDFSFEFQDKIKNSNVKMALLFKLEGGFAHIRYAYAIDDGRYKKDLKRFQTKRA